MATTVEGARLRPRRAGPIARPAACVLLAVLAAPALAAAPVPGVRLAAGDTLTVRAPVPAGGGRVCDQRFVGIRVDVHAADGRPVHDAVVEVRQEPGSVLVRRVQGAVDGRSAYIVLDDETPGPLTPAAVFSVVARRDTRRATARLLVGADAGGCHVRLLQGPTVLQLR